MNSIAQTENLIIDYTHQNTYKVPIATTEFYIFNIKDLDPVSKNAFGQNLIHFACTTFEEEGVDNAKVKKLILHLIALGGDINTYQDNVGMTALHMAVLSNKPKLVKFLLQNGADTSLVIQKGSLKGNTAFSMLDERSRTDEADKIALRKIIKPFLRN